MSSISFNILDELYINEKKSAMEIAKLLDCSHSKVNYWIKKHSIPKRSISDAIYTKANPNGDPFGARKVVSKEDNFLFGLGMGLYWGEGTKADKYSVRLGNTDPALIKKFIEFLETIYDIKKEKLRFGLQIFSDMNPDKALDFWVKELGFSKKYFQKVIVTPARGIGSYRKKIRHGVLTVQFGNIKLRDIIVGEVENLRKPR